ARAGGTPRRALPGVRPAHAPRPDGRVSLALVTGATGFIGAHVAADLLANGWRVRALVRPESMDAARWPAGCRPAPGGLPPAAAVRRAADRTEAVFHVRAHYSPP